MDGKVAVITGGNSGIGRATAEALARRGAHVVIACRNETTAAQAAKEITAATRQTVDTVRLDLADLESVREAAAEIRDRWDRLDVLVNNAGLARTRRGTTKQGFETTFGVNYLGHVLLTELLLDRLRASAPSRIVMVGAHAHHLARSGLDFGDLQSARSYRTMLAYGRSKLASSPDVEGVTGGYFVDRKQAAVSSAAADRDAARRLWAETERMLADGHP